MKKATMIILFSILLQISNAQVCNITGDEIKIYQWIPSLGSVAKYSAGIIDANETVGFIIILGRTDEGIFSIEGGDKSDASGERYANLMFTSFEGKRDTFRLTDFNTESFDDDDSVRNEVKQEITSELLRYEREDIYHPGSLKAINYSVNKNYEDAAWSLRIKEQGSKRTLEWTLEAEPFMCWCLFEWRCGWRRE